MTLTESHNLIEQALQGASRFNQVGIWLGEIQELVNTPKSVPAAFVILSGIDYEGPTVGVSLPAVADTIWSLVIFEYVNSQPGNSGIAAYGAIEATVAAITGLRVGNRRLWPVKTRLLGGVKNSVACYGVQFTLL